MFYVSVNFEATKKADHNLKNAEDKQSFYDALFVIYQPSGMHDDFQVNLHVSWDTLYVRYYVHCSRTNTLYKIHKFEFFFFYQNIIVALENSR